jgi:predicted nucleotidyltransferase component of viral defense system
MQNLINLINQAKSKSGSNELQLQNLIREYLQVLILKNIYQNKSGKCLSFMGGTALRICYDLKRFSEDLDFALDRPANNYSFSDLNEKVSANLKNNGFKVDVSVQEEKTVQKSNLKFAGLLNQFGLSPLKDQKLHIKIEVDIKPPAIEKNKAETFFVTKFNEIFPIIIHSADTLFAGKIGAILTRPYNKGRDFYDLVWYLTKKTPINLNYLNARLGKNFTAEKEVYSILKAKLSTIDIALVMGDIENFLEDPSEKEWIKNFPSVAEKLLKEAV